ncbi:MAG: hypothetical protein M3419_04190 [Actinomycetota bacterium]|nr:hypothetical protein [Actinomycetota bacterium]
MRIASVIVVIWLLIGLFAAFQRDYFSGDDAECAEVGTIALTIVAGPLNYVGVNPKVDCEVPRPSE